MPAHLAPATLLSINKLLDWSIILLWFEMADQEIKTSIDSLVAYLNEHGETNVSTVASALGVNENIIIGWSNALEKANIIRILHKSGRVFLAPIHGKMAVQGAREEDREHLQTELESQIEIVNQVSAKIDEFSRTLTKIDSLFNTKYKNVKMVLDKLSKAEGYIEAVEKKMSARSARIRNVSEQAKADYDQAQKYLNQLSSFSVDTNSASAISQELHTLLKAYEKNASDMSKSLEAVIYQYRKGAIEVSRSIREKHEQFEQVLDYEDKQIRQYKQLATDYKRSADALIRRTGAAEKSVLDEIYAGNAQIDKLSGLATSEMAGVRTMVTDIKKDLGGIADLNDGINKLRKDLAEVSSMRDSLLSELKKADQSMRTAAASKIMLSQDAQSRATNAMGSVSSLTGKVDKMGRDIKVLGDKKEKGSGKEDDK
jgi:chromosome segregation ATPase